MPDTYETKDCAFGCVPGLKCEHCAPVENFSETANATASGYFLPSDTRRAAFPRPLEEVHLREWVLAKLHPAGAKCACGAAVSEGQQKNFWGGDRCTCHACGREFKASSGTFMQGTHMSYAQVWLLAVLVDLMETGVTPQVIADKVGVSADTVRLWIKKFKAFEPHGR